MQIITNEKLIKRYTLISRICLFGGMIILIAGFIISIKYPQYQSFVLISLIIGFFLSQIGILLTNRWSRQPRADTILDKSLKGFDKRYSIFHFSTPAAHLLVGPAGVWILFPRFQRGTITYSNGKWHQKGGNLYLKLFAQEGLGRPDLEILNEKDLTIKHLKKLLPEAILPDINAALIFTSEKVVIDVEDDPNAPAVTVQIGKLKEYLRKIAKAKPLSPEKYKEIQNVLLLDKGLKQSTDDQQDAEQD